MTLDPDCKGYTTESFSFSYTWKTTVLYALGVGAQADELAYLYEAQGPRVYPTFAVIPAYAAVHACMLRTGGDLSKMVHGTQSINVPAALAPSGTLHTTGDVRGVYDLKRFAQVVIGTTTTNEQGECVCETEWSLLFLDQGGFSGERRPKGEAAPTPPKATPPTFTKTQATQPEQALLYRLSGDENPLHVDPSFAAAAGFPQGPLLHGLATYGFAARAVIHSALGGDATRLRRFEAQFRKPVWPGETLVTQGWALEGGRGAAQTQVEGRPDAVMTAWWSEA